MVVVLVGPPGSGKDELTKAMVAAGFTEFSTGKMLREMLQEKHEPSSKTYQLVEACRPFVENGEMVPDNIICDLWRQYAPRLAKIGQKLVCNGFPRTPAQSDAFIETAHLFDHIDLLILEVLEMICLMRMEKRSRPDDVHRLKRIKQFFQLTVPAIKRLESCKLIHVKKPIKADHPDLTPEQSMAKVARRAFALIGLPTSTPARSMVMA